MNWNETVMALVRESHDLDAALDMLSAVQVTTRNELLSAACTEVRNGLCNDEYDLSWQGVHGCTGAVIDEQTLEVDEDLL